MLTNFQNSFAVLLLLLLGDGGGGHWLVQMEWRTAGWSMYLPLLIFLCAIKSRSSLLAPAHPGGPGKRAVKWLWCGGGTTITRVLWPVYRTTCISWHLQLLEDFVEAKFYCPHDLADGN